MRSLPMLLALLSVSVALGPESAAAAVTSPENSSVGPVLVGDAGGGSGVEFVVVPRGYANAPQAGRFIALRFTSPGLVLREDQESGTVVDCDSRTLGRYSPYPDGKTVFHPRFGGSASADEIEVYSDGVLLARIPARSTDIDGSGETALPDLSFFSDAIFEAGGGTHLDFNLDGAVNLADLDLLRRDLFLGTPGTLCP